MTRISKIKGLIKHPNSRVFWFRRAIPADLRKTKKLEKWEVKESLGTSDLREAEIRAAHLWAFWTSRFDDLRNNRKSGGINPTKGQLGEIAVWWRDLWPEADKIEQADGMIVSEAKGSDGKIVVTRRPMSRDEKFEFQRSRLEEIEDRLYKGDLIHLRSTAIGILKEKGFSTHGDIVDQLVPVLAAAERDAFEIQTRRHMAHSARDLLERDPSEYVTSDLRVSQLLDEYLQYIKPRIQTEQEWRMIFDRFSEVIGDKAARNVTKSDIRSFISTIEKLPTRPKKAIKVLPIKEMVAAADRGKLPRLSVETVRKHVGAVRAVFEWAILNDFLQTNPAAKMAPKRVPVEQKRWPFSTTDLVKVFDPKIYYDYPKDNAEFWVPLLSLYTGARIEELAQLHCSDIWYEENVPVIQISPDSSFQSDDDSKRVKNQSSTRVIPVHRELVEAGFINFVEQCKKTGRIRLFSDLDRDSIGRLAKATSRKFIRYIRSIGITSKSKVFHSFRHTFKDACRDAGINEDVHDRFTGHSSRSIGRHYGSGHTLSVLQKELNKVEYRGVATISWGDYQRHIQGKVSNK